MDTSRYSHMHPVYPSAQRAAELARREAEVKASALAAQLEAAQEAVAVERDHAREAAGRTEKEVDSLRARVAVLEAAAAGPAAAVAA